MKKLTVEIGDDTHAEMVEEVQVKHLSDLGEGLKCAVDHFVKLNEGAFLPPISIRVTEQNAVVEEAPEPRKAGE